VDICLRLYLHFETLAIGCPFVHPIGQVRFIVDRACRLVTSSFDESFLRHKPWRNARLSPFEIQYIVKNARVALLKFVRFFADLFGLPAQTISIRETHRPVLYHGCTAFVAM